MDKRNGGISLFTVLLIIFVTLKLAGIIHWPWIWVLAPLWIPFVIGAIILTIAITVAGFIMFFRD